MNKHLFSSHDRPRSTVDTVVGMIKDLLVTKKLKPGDAIPSENELAEALSISRGSIREAMKVLSTLGVVDVRQGQGTFIATTVNKKLFDPLLFSLLVSDSEIEDLAELRILMEIGIVKLIIKRAEDTDIARLEAVYSEMAEQMRQGVTDQDELFGTDKRFHTIMGEITHNPLVQHVYEFVIELFAPTMHPGHGVESHKKIVDALYARDTVKAIAAVEEHDELWQELNRSDTETRKGAGTGRRNLE